MVSSIRLLILFNLVCVMFGLGCRFRQISGQLQKEQLPFNLPGPAKLIHVVRPQYSFPASSEIDSVHVKVKFTVCESGAVSNLVFLSYSDIPFRTAASNAVVQFRYEPAKSNHISVSSEVVLPVSAHRLLN